VTLAFLTTALCALELVRPFQLYFDPRYILVEGQLWRLATNFFFFGNLGECVREERERWREGREKRAAARSLPPTLSP
jgi:hypothetical protein